MVEGQTAHPPRRRGPWGDLQLGLRRRADPSGSFSLGERSARSHPPRNHREGSETESDRHAGTEPPALLLQGRHRGAPSGDRRRQEKQWSSSFELGSASRCPFSMKLLHTSPRSTNRARRLLQTPSRTLRRENRKSNLPSRLEENQRSLRHRPMPGAQETTGEGFPSGVRFPIGEVLTNPRSEGSAVPLITRDF